jgi:hypothetical protein
MENKVKIIENLIATAECFAQQMSQTRAEMILHDLREFSDNDILAALEKCRKTKKFMPSIAEIIEEMPTGWPSADEAWGLVPRTEDESTVWTQEIAEAWGAAYPMLCEGDKVAARMAFKAAYERLISDARNEGRKPDWVPSLGHDKRGHDAALQKAVELGRIDASHAKALSPSMPDSNVRGGLVSIADLSRKMLRSAR